jgi:hypothetical protein
VLADAIVADRPLSPDPDEPRMLSLLHHLLMVLLMKMKE